MGAYERITERLSPLGVYKLNCQSITDFELKEYGRGIDTLEALITKLFTSCFIDTVSAHSSTQLVKLYSLPASLSVLNLKKIVKQRMAISNSDFTVAGVLKCLAAGGFTCTLAEDFATNIVTVTVKSDMRIFTDNEQKKAYIAQCLPCHVKANIILK